MTASGIPPTLTPLAPADVITRLESLLGCCDAPEILRTQLRQLIRLLQAQGLTGVSRDSRRGHARRAQQSSPTRWPVTSRRRAADALRDRPARLDWVLGATGVGLWFNTLPLDRLNWDEQTRRLFFVPSGVEPTMALFWRRLHPDDRQRTRATIKAALGDGKLYQIDHRAVDPESGTIRWIRSAGQATRDAQGRAVRVDCLNYAISGYKLSAPPATRLAQVAGRHTAGALIAVLPHELSQPLAAIAMYSNATSALIQSGKLAPDVLADVSGRIEAQVKRAAEILARLRELVHPDRAEPSSTDLCQTLAEAVALLRPFAAHKQVQLFVDFPAEPVTLQVSKTVIGQIVLNLLFNSIEAIEQAGSAQRRVRLSVHPEPVGVRVTVQDSGPGIRPEDAERIFQAFESDKSEGCGLGLAISRSLIEPLGGRLWVDRRVTEGATLHLRLPRSAHIQATQ